MTDPAEQRAADVRLHGSCSGTARQSTGTRFHPTPRPVQTAAGGVTIGTPYATVAIAAGVPAEVIAEQLGHHSPGFTLAQYAHVLRGMQADAASKVAALIRGA